jgi:Putative beta-lactamase-inhibitor-like, PepSY-like
MEKQTNNNLPLDSKDYKDISKEEALSNRLNDGLQSVSNGVDYLLHGDSEEEKPKIFHPLQVEQHHLLLVLFCIIAILLLYVYKSNTKPDEKSTHEESISVVQPPTSPDDPATWSVAAATPVNVKNIPTKLIVQMNSLYPDVNPASFRWLRTPKGWNAFYDIEKAKVKFSLEGYWLETEEKDFPIEKIPEYLNKRIKMSYPDYTLTRCERETISSGNYYELMLKRNRPDNINEEFEVYLSEKASNYANLYEGDDY